MARICDLRFAVLRCLLINAKSLPQSQIPVEIMATVKVRNLRTKKSATLGVRAIFGVELNESLIHAAVRNYLANRRQ